MPYYSGIASTYDDLKNVLVNACQDHGWSYSDGILSKGTMFVRPSVNPTPTTNRGPGLLIQGGTGKNGASLMNPSTGEVRIGPFGLSPSTVPEPLFPLNYHIFIFEDEVYLIIKYSIDRFFYLAFGKSTITNTLWISGTLGLNFLNSVGGVKAIQISLTDAGQVQSGSYPSSSGFFLQTNTLGATLNATDMIYDTDLGWLGGNPTTNVGGFSALYSTQPLWGRLPANWSQDSVFLPINPIMRLASNKWMLFADIQNARYVRIDNYEPEQIVTLGNDKWMVLPFHRKNSAAPNGGSNVNHTGTFGWAIRYDGP